MRPETLQKFNDSKMMFDAVLRNLEYLGGVLLEAGNETLSKKITDIHRHGEAAIEIFKHALDEAVTNDLTNAEISTIVLLQSALVGAGIDPETVTKKKPDIESN
jgi:hypothetical protein